VNEETLRYVQLDFAANRDALVQRIRSRWPGEWNDFSSSNLGMVLVDLIAWNHTTQTFLINKQVAEMFVSTMTLRESAIRIGSLVGYRLASAVPASVLCEATIESAIENDVIIPEGSLVRTSTNIPFEVVGTYTIEAGNTAPRTTIVTFSTTSTSSTALPCEVTAEGGSYYIDAVDTTIDLKDYITIGQTIQLTSSVATVDTTPHIIQQITSAEGAVSNNRIVVATPMIGTFTSDNFEAEVYESRIELIQGQTITEKFVSPSVAQDGYTIRLGYRPVIDDSVSITVNGIVWTSFTSLYLAQSLDYAYTVKNLPNDSTIIQFGDGKFGRVIPTDATILVTYRIGGGSIGNVSVRAIGSSLTGLIDGLSNPITVNIQNVTASGLGGQDRETVDQARDLIPAFTQTNNRAVTLSDWQSLASGFSDPTYGSVSYARASTQSGNSLLEGNIVVVYAWTTGPSGGLMSLTPQLKTSLKAYLMQHCMATDYVIVSDGSSRPIPISLQFKTNPGYDVATVTRSLSQAVSSFVAALTPGSTIIHSNLITTLNNVTGVDHVDVVTPTSNLAPSGPNELFTTIQDDYVYSIGRVYASTVDASEDDEGVALTMYTAQLATFPTAPWSNRLFIGTTELAVMPDHQPGFARLYRVGILSVSDDYRSTINLLTGQIVLYVIGSPGELTSKLVSLKGYDQEKPTDVYIGYVGVNSQSKRREIRSAIRTWFQGLGVGSALYTTEVDGVIQSKANLTGVVARISDVTSVSRVSIGTPGNTSVKITAGISEILRVGNVVINNSVD
jgi:uncharacterized phage protein gp47/JayE